MRRFFFGLSGRMVMACALIAVLCVVVTGAVLYNSTRNNILQTEQNSLLDDFSAALRKAQDPLECVARDCSGLSDESILASVANNGPWYIVILPESGPGMNPNAIPDSFRQQVQSSHRISWLRERRGLSYRFLMGAPLTVSLRQVPDNSVFGGPSAPNQELPGPVARTVKAYMYAAYPLDAQERQIDSLAVSTVWLVALMAVVGAVAGVLLARWFTRPVRSLRKEVDRLDAEHGTLTVDVKGVQELTGLVEAFNAASSRLSATMAELTAKEAQSRRFVADVSHELRTPVTAMVAMADVLANSKDAPEQVQEAAAVTVRSARRLHHMTESLLEISRFDADRNTVQAENFNIRDQVTALLETRGMGTEVEVSVDSGLCFTTDPRRFDVVVGNLLVNAAHHGAAPIKVRAVLEEDSLMVEVSDHGGGVPAESKSRLFDRFYKTDSSRSRGGSGLGLSLVQENCRLLGGTVELSSASQPTTFTVRLPQIRSAAA